MSANQNGLDKAQTSPLILAMAERFQLNAQTFVNTVVKSVFPDAKASPEQLMAFLVVANEYKLNPFTKEIYAFPTRNGGIQPIVSIDGWATIINSHPQNDGVEFRDDVSSGGSLASVTCLIYRKDRSHPTQVTEYMNECRRDTDTWKKWPARMLRHKALIQCSRIAFGFSGIIDPDEAERFLSVDSIPASVEREMPRRRSETAKAEPAVIDVVLEPQTEGATEPSAEVQTEATSQKLALAKSLCLDLMGLGLSGEEISALIDKGAGVKELDHVDGADMTKVIALLEAEQRRKAKKKA